MKVPVAFAHEAVRLALFECGEPQRVLALRPCAKRILPLAICRIVAHRADRVEVLPRDPQDRVRRPEARALARRLDAAVESGDLRGQRVDVGGTQRAGCQHPARERLLRELAHLHRVLDDGPITTNDRPVDAAGDRDDVEIDRRREPAIEAQLLLAVELPLREGREVQEPEVDRLLDLVGVRARQQHVRDVRLQVPDALAAGPEDGGVGERRNQPRLARRVAGRAHRRPRALPLRHSVAWQFSCGFGKFLRLRSSIDMHQPYRKLPGVEYTERKLIPRAGSGCLAAEPAP